MLCWISYNILYFVVLKKKKNLLFFVEVLLFKSDNYYDYILVFKLFGEWCRGEGFNLVYLYLILLIFVNIYLC